MIALKYSINISRKSVHTVRSIGDTQLYAPRQSRSKKRTFWVCSTVTYVINSKIESMSACCEIELVTSRIQILYANSSVEKSLMVHWRLKKSDVAGRSSGRCEHTSKLSYGLPACCPRVLAWTSRCMNQA